MPFEFMIELKEQIVLGSYFVSDYENSFGIEPEKVCMFFDSYLDYLNEIMSDDGIKDDCFFDSLEEYDTIENFANWCAIDCDPFGIDDFDDDFQEE